MRLLDALPNLGERVRRAPRLWIGLDFDGTLSHHVGDPATAAVTPEARAALRVLAGVPSVSLAFISGRAIADLRHRIGLPDAAYAGNHGLEILHAGETVFDPLTVRVRPVLASVADRLAVTGSWPGVCFQDKYLSLAVDHRDSSFDVKAAIPPAVNEAIADFPELFAHHSPNGSEVRPVGGWHKGTAVDRLWELQTGRTALPFFLGDDRTDEDGFAALPDGVTACVGDRPSAARYRAKCPDEVAMFLTWLTTVVG